MNHWYDFLIGITFSRTSTGHITLYVDGNPVPEVDTATPTMIDEGDILKQGLYRKREDVNHDQTVDHDHLRVGPTLDSIK